MPLTVTALPNMLTTAGGTTSNAVGALDDAFALSLRTPATMTSTSVSVQVELTSTGTDFGALQSGGVDIVIDPGKVTVIHPVTFKQIRVVTGGAEAAARTFGLSKSVQT